MTTDVYVVDAVRTPIGRCGGALAAVRPDDLAATAVRALADRHPGLDPARIDDVFLGDANAAGEDNRDVARMAPANRVPDLGAGHDPQPALRFRSGGGDRRVAGDRGGRRVDLRGRRRRVDEPGAVGAAQAGEGLPARPRDPALDDARLADGQPADAGRVDRPARRGSGGARRPVQDRPRGAGCVRARQSPASCRGLGRRRLRRRGGRGARRRAGPGREDPRGHLARRAGPAQTGGRGGEAAVRDRSGGGREDRCAGPASAGAICPSSS